MRPATVHALDQAAAAGREAWRQFTELADRAGLEYGQVRPDGPVGRVLDRLVERATAGTLGRCAHLAGRFGPASWAAWRPGALRCDPCLGEIALAIHGREEDRRCDCCRRLGRTVSPNVVLLPPVVLDLGDGPPIGGGPITTYFGLCPSCHRRAQAATNPTTGGTPSPRPTTSWRTA